MTEQTINSSILEGEKKYRRGEVIGVGGFGLVYEAYDETNNEKVVIKVLKRKSKEETFKKEINIMKQIQHPSVVTLLDTFRTTDNIFCAVMNYAENGSVLSDLMRNGPFNEDKMKMHMKSILEGLDSIHKQGIIHNDIKAANILINKGKALIADFGASIDTKLTKNCRSSIGSPHWMSPETASGQVLTVKSDIWSIGILAIEMLTGKPPLSNFPGSTVLLILKETKRVPISLKVSDICLSFIKMCLQSNPKYRPGAADLLCHPFFMEKGTASKDCQKSSVFIDWANQITTDESLCSQILTENHDEILGSLKNLNDISDRFILFETIALFTKIVDDQVILPIIEYMLKCEVDKFTSKEVIKIILLFIKNSNRKSQLLKNSGLLNQLESKIIKENPLIYIVQEQLKAEVNEVVDIDDTISFLSQFRYDYIYNKLVNNYQFLQIPRRLRLLLNEKMHEITSESFSAALRMINCCQLNESQIKCFCHFFDITITKNLTMENARLILNILEKAPLNALGHHQQTSVSFFVVNCIINQNISKQNNVSMFSEMIQKVVGILEKMIEINIPNLLEKNSEFWKVLYQNHSLNAISTLANICTAEFEKNVDIELSLQMMRHSIESNQHEDFEFFYSMFKNSKNLCSSFVNDNIFTEFCKMLCQVPVEYLNKYLKIIVELIKVPNKPSNFCVCLKGPLTKISIFKHSHDAEVLLEMLNKE